MLYFDSHHNVRWIGVNTLISYLITLTYEPMTTDRWKELRVIIGHVTIQIHQQPAKF